MQDRIRVYFSERCMGRSFIRYADLALDDPTKVIDLSQHTVLENGKPGTFDDEGQIPSYARLLSDHEVMLWYSGWNTRNTIPYHNATGACYSDDGGRTFRRRHDGPVLDRTEKEPYLRVTPCCADGRMWYVSGVRWEKVGDRYEPIYVIRLHEEHKGNPIAIPQAYPDECFSRPWVTQVGAIWRMWYCHRRASDYRDGENAYRIGYADSIDGKSWYRHDGLANLPRSDFDSTMQAYPAAFQVKGKTYMLYNGNTFGKFGFGLAVAE